MKSPFNENIWVGVGRIGCIAFFLGLYLAGGAADTAAPWKEIAGPFWVGTITFLIGGVLMWIANVLLDATTSKR